MTPTPPSFNPAQLATYDEARAMRDLINGSNQFFDHHILPDDDSVGVKPVVDPNFPWLPPKVPQVGIYIPTWISGPHADPEPNIGESLFLHFRFDNGREGFNVGLWREKFKSFPGSPDYVLSYLANESR